MVSSWEIGLKITGWASSHSSLSKLLAHLRRKSSSEASRTLYCSVIHSFCQFVGKKKGIESISPDDIVGFVKEDIESLVQEFCDRKIDSPNYANTRLQVLKSFFKINGFKGDRALEVETYSVSGFGRRKPQYVPSLVEALKMAVMAGSVRNRAIILVLLSTGLRVSTICAILVSDIKDELERGLERLHIWVNEDMKKVVANACKGRREYSCFTNAEATESIRLYLKERIRKYGKIDDQEPLFLPELGRLRRAKRIIKPLTPREVQLVVKEAARKAGIEKWKDVTPHAIRKTYSTWVLCRPLADGGNMDVKTQEVLIGHKLPGSQDTYYDRTKTEELRKVYSKLVFTPPVEGRVELYAIYRVLHSTLGIDFVQLLDTEKTNLGRDLTSEEQLRVIEKTLKNTISRSKLAETSKDASHSTKETIELRAIDSDLNLQKQTALLFDCEYHELKIEPKNPYKKSSMSQSQAIQKRRNDLGKTGQTKILFFC